jgi:hypothetical protein
MPPHRSTAARNWLWLIRRAQVTPLLFCFPFCLVVSPYLLLCLLLVVYVGGGGPLLQCVPASFLHLSRPISARYLLNELKRTCLYLSICVCMHVCVYLLCMYDVRPVLYGQSLHIPFFFLALSPAVFVPCGVCGGGRGDHYCSAYLQCVRASSAPRPQYIISYPQMRWLVEPDSTLFRFRPVFIERYHFN